MVSKKLLLLWKVRRHGNKGAALLRAKLTRTAPVAIWIGTVQTPLNLLRGIPHRDNPIFALSPVTAGPRGNGVPRLPPFGLHLDPVDLHHIPTPFRTWGRDIPSLQVPGRTRSTAACTGGRDDTPRPSYHAEGNAPAGQGGVDPALPYLPSAPGLLALSGRRGNGPQQDVHVMAFFDSLDLSHGLISSFSNRWHGCRRAPRVFPVKRQVPLLMGTKPHTFPRLGR